MNKKIRTYKLTITCKIRNINQQVEPIENWDTVKFNQDK